MFGPYSRIWKLLCINKKRNIRNLINKTMQKAYNVRWAFKASTWNPSEEEILSASSYIQPEEKERISRFVFIDDAKSSLIGRLMMRKFVHLSTTIPYNDIKLGRDSFGKPCLMGVGDIPVSFNVSHQGDYVVLAGHSFKKVGVDIMKIEPPVNKDIPDFFRLMNRQFSNQEWKTIHSCKTEMEKVACFYRHWCLKESYVKNTGFGITVPLHEISFSIKTLNMEVGKFITDTVLYERGSLKPNWVFEETLLDDKHAVAVSMQTKELSDMPPEPYQFLTFNKLVEEAKPLNGCDFEFSSAFMKKKIKCTI